MAERYSNEEGAKSSWTICTLFRRSDTPLTKIGPRQNRIFGKNGGPEGVPYVEANAFKTVKNGQKSNFVKTVGMVSKVPQMGLNGPEWPFLRFLRNFEKIDF